MSDEAKGRVFTEDEHTAILADRVATETAALTDQIAAKDAEIADLKAQMDTVEAARLAAEKERDDTKAAFDAFKSEVEQAKEHAQRKDERVAKVKEAASHLTDEFFNDERVERIAAMTDEFFDGWLSDMREGAAKVGVSNAPREAANLVGSAVEPPRTDSGASAARGFLLRDYHTSDQPKEG